MRLVSLFESYRLRDLDPDHAYEIFRKSYEQETGSAWSKEKFLSRAREWTFYGDEDGFIAVRIQRSGMKKLVGVAGDPRSITRGIQELTQEGGPIWGAVSEPLARMAKKRGLIAPHLYPGGAFFIRALIGTIPAGVFGGVEPTVRKDGGVVFQYDDVGEAVKYFVASKEYFAHAIGLPEVAEKLREVPGLKTFLKLIGL